MAEVLARGDECDEDSKVVIAPVFQGRLEESSERTTRGSARTGWSSWYNRSLQALTLPTFNSSNRETILVLVYILMGIVIVISTLLVIRMFTAKIPLRARL